MTGGVHPLARAFAGLFFFGLGSEPPAAGVGGGALLGFSLSLMTAG